MPQSAGGAPTAGGGGARSRVTAEAQPIKPSQDGKASNNYGINGANGEHQVRWSISHYIVYVKAGAMGIARGGIKIHLKSKITSHPQNRPS